MLQASSEMPSNSVTTVTSPLQGAGVQPPTQTIVCRPIWTSSPPKTMVQPPPCRLPIAVTWGEGQLSGCTQQIDCPLASTGSDPQWSAIAAHQPPQGCQPTPGYSVAHESCHWARGQNAAACVTDWCQQSHQWSCTGGIFLDAMMLTSPSPCQLHTRHLWGSIMWYWY